MADARELLIKLTVDAAQADRRLKDISKSVGGLESTLKGAGSALKGFVGGLAGAVSIGAMVTAFKLAANSMDDMVKAAQKVGTTVENLSALNYAAQQSGVSFEGLQTGLKKLNQNLADVDKGTTDAAKALRALGVTGADSPEQALAKIADEFAKSADGAGKTAVAMAIFGKAGADLIPMLNAGAAGLDAFKKRAEELGIIIDTKTAKQAELFNDSLGDMQAAMGGIIKQLTAGMLPAMSGLVKAMADSINVGNGWKETGTNIGKSLTLVATAALQAYGGISKMITAWAGLSAAAATLFENGFYGKRNFAGAKAVLDAMVEDLNKTDIRVNAMIEALSQAITKASTSTAAATGTTQRLSNAYGSLATDGNKAADAAKRLKEETEAWQRVQKALADAQAETDAWQKAQWQKGQDAADAIRAEAKAMEDAADPLRVYQEEIAKIIALNEALKRENDGVGLSMKAMNHAFEQAGENYKNATKPIEESKDLFGSLKDAIDGYAKDMAGAWVKAIASGQSFKDSFKDITANVLQNIAQMILQINVIEPMMKRMKASLDGGGSFWSSLLSGFGFANGGAFATPTGLPYGVYNQPTFFPMPGSGPLQKFARGGVLGEAGPEAIMPLRRGSDGKLGVSAAPVNVNVINNAGVGVSVEQSGDDVNIIIERTRRTIANDIRRGGNDVSSAMESTYRISRGG